MSTAEGGAIWIDVFQNNVFMWADNNYINLCMHCIDFKYYLSKSVAHSNYMLN